MAKRRGLLVGSGSPREEESEFDLSIVLPVRRAEACLAGTLKRIATWLRTMDWRTEIIVVDDASTDATQASATRFRKYFDGFQLVSHEVKRGIGAAARSGVLAARGRYVIICDPGLATPIENVSLIVDRLSAGSDVAIASHRIERDARGERPFLERAAETTFMALSQLVVRVDVRDSLCGLRGFRKRAARKIAERSRVSGAAFGIEWIALAQWFGFQVIECPVRWIKKGSRPAVSAGHAPGILRDLWRTRQRLSTDGYAGPVPTKELLHETSFVKLDRAELQNAYRRRARSA
jgi:glycosyltransferase involved in cell wall biosynthesis